MHDLKERREAEAETSNQNELNTFRDAIRRFIAIEIAPTHYAWEEQGFTPRELWSKAGKAGFLAVDVPERYGGAGLDDFRFNAAVIEEIAKSRYVGADFATHSEMVVPYVTEFGTEEQKREWLPAMVSGDLIGAVGFTEPSAGSDLAGIRTKATIVDDGYKIKGQKAFINNATVCDFVLIAARTRDDIPMGISLFLVERSALGFSSGKPQTKLGLPSQDTADIYLDDVFVPSSCLIGRENAALGYIMKVMRRERMAIAIQAAYMAETLLDSTLKYVFDRKIRGTPLAQYQNTRFTLAKLHAKLELAKCYVRGNYNRILDGRITDAESALAKWWSTEACYSVAHECLQLHGGAGYERDSIAARGFVDSRGALIYGGSSEIMLEIIASSLRP